MTEISLDRQIEIQATDYLRLGFHTQLGEKPHAFVDRFGPIMEMAGRLAIPDAPLAILTVIPEEMVSLEHQLRLSNNRAFLPSHEMVQLTDWEVEPVEPYALLGVHLGRQVSDLSADVAKAEIEARGRTGFRLIELVNLGIHKPEEFTVDNIRGRYAVETHHVLNEQATVVDLYRYGDSLKIKRDPGTINDPQWTTPSYTQRIVAG